MRKNPSSSKFINSKSQKNQTIILGDITSKETLLKATKDIDIVFHLAAKTSEKASESKESYNTNVEGTKNLIQACLKNSVKHLIIVSSQSTKRHKRGLYGETKRLADLEVAKIPSESKLKYTIVKPTIVYGRGSKGLFTKILNLIQKLPITPIIGSGNYQLQPIYIDDLTTALVKIANNPKTFGKTYDLAGKTRLSFNSLIAEIQTAQGQKKKIVHFPYSLTYAGIKSISLISKNPPITTDNLLGLMQETKIDLTPAEQDFSFAPISFKDGITETIWGKRDSTKIQIGIIGLGKMGLLHGSLINYMPDTQLCGVFDVNQKVKKQIYSLNIKVPFYTNLPQFLDETKPDAVIISIPPAFTLRTIQEVAKRNIHFLVEKPLADSLEHAKEIVSLTEKHHLTGAVGYMYGYTAQLKKIEQLLQKKILGKINSFTGSAYVTQVLSHKKGWRYDKKTAGGGCVTLHGTHLLYLTYRLFGLPQKVKSTLEFPYSKVEDKASINVSYTQNKPLTGTLKISWSEKGYTKLTIKLHIEGENGFLSIEEDQLTINLFSATPEYPKGKTIITRDDLKTSEFELGGDGYYDEDRTFVDAIRSNKHKLNTSTQKMVTIQDGFAVQRFLHSIYASHSKKMEVKP